MKFWQLGLIGSSCALVLIVGDVFSNASSQNIAPPEGAETNTDIVIENLDNVESSCATQVIAQILTGYVSRFQFSTAVSEGKVYFGSKDNHLYALDIETGQEIWKFETDDSVVSSPVVSEGVVYFGSQNNHLYALDVETGQELWKFETDDSVVSSPAVSEGVVYFGSYYNHLYALDIETGQELWKFESHEQAITTLVVSEGVVYFGGLDHFLRLGISRK